MTLLQIAIETASRRFDIVFGETRLFEWGATWMMMSWALILMLPGETLAMSAAFEPFEATGGDAFWGGIAFIVAMIGGVALFANGHWHHSHLFRAGAAGLRACFWVILSLGLALAVLEGHPAPEALAIYPVLAVLETVVSKRNAEPN